MEEQPEVPITRSIESDNSEPTLRFPRPQVNRQLASWISSSQTDIMQPLYPPEDAALSDSTFELINTDDESQDGRATESISSFDYARADDVHSLAGTEHTNADTGDRTDTDSEAEEDEALNGSRASSIQYAEQSLENPSSRVPTPVGYEHASDTANTPLMQSIEFQEAEGPIHLQKVSVKHTIRDFNAEESAALLSGLDMTNPPERLIGTIRQTMAQSCLSTREPLRILYTGSLVARHDIIYKISSAYMASSCSDKADDDGYLYNVVPISSFGSPKEPEVELMMTSQYQIKVDVCKSAKVIVYEGQSFPGETVYSITIGDKTYKSAYCPSGSVIEPVWTLPHIAVFYVTDNDDEETRGTRNAAWQFMRRHLVPCILVSNSQSFKQPHSVTDEWRQNIDQHAIHLCLESRDSLRQIELIRLPIDLSSFLNIDARQMNRNLAYLTGLHEPAGSRLGNGADSVLLKPAQRFREWWYGLSRHVVRHQASSLSAAIGLILGSLIWAFLLRFAISRYGANIAPLSSPTCSHTGGVMSTSDLQSSSISISTSTVTINLTSTKTVRISQANASPSNTGVIPFVGFLSDIHELHKGTVCSTEVYSKNEILVKIPLSTKTSWLAKDSITIDVFRGNDAIKTKFSSIDEGIIIEIPSSEAYGVLNISVNTTRRPKVNETFEVDFGKGRLGEALDFGVHLAQDFGGRILDAAHEAARRVEASVPTLGSLTDGMVAKVVEAGEAAHEFSARLGAQATNHFKGSLNSDAMAKRWKSVREEADRQARRAEDLSAQLDLSILRAQVASRLWWLKIQRKTEEHDRYQQRAEVYVAQKYQEAFKARRERADMEKKELRARRKKERLEARCQSGFSRWTKQCKQDA